MGQVNVDGTVSPEDRGRETARLRYRAIKPTIRFQPVAPIESETDWSLEEIDTDVPQHPDALQLRTTRDR